MIELKTEEQINAFFGNKVFKFDIMCDGVAEYSTVIPIKVEGTYYNFKITFFTEDKPFAAYDNLEGLLSDCQVFEVYALTTISQETHHLYQKPYNKNYNK